MVGPKDISDLGSKLSKQMPKYWQQFGQPYLQIITRKDIVILNVLAGMTGIAAGFAAIGFRYLIGFFQNTIMHHQLDYHLISPLSHVRGHWIFLILPAGLLVSTLLTRWFAKEAKGHGVPEVIEAVLLNNGKMRKRTVAIKALASSITIASGGSVGREGPIVQIGSGIGSALGQLFTLKPKIIKTLVGCGAAGAIAATFNTPIAGVIFAIEILILELKTKSFVPLVISAVFATVVSRFYLGNEPAFFVPSYSLTSHNELIFYFGLGILSGVVSVFVIRTLYGFEDFVEKIKVPFFLKPIIGGLILASVGTFYPQIYGVGYETVSNVLSQNSTLELMAALVILKILAMSLTLACGGSGGVFAPSLYIGAMLGGTYGYIVNMYYPDSTAGYGAYALVGMAAMFSGTGRATFSAIVILFEMTLNYSIILPLMFTCVLADQISWAIFKDSVYSMKLKRKGLSFVTNISVNIMSVTLLKDIMTKSIETLDEGLTVSEAQDIILKSHHSVYPVITKDRMFVGNIFSEDLISLSPEHASESIKNYIKSSQSIAYEFETVSGALLRMDKKRDPRIMVLNLKTKALVGLVCPIDIVRLSSSEESE